MSGIGGVSELKDVEQGSRDTQITPTVTAHTSSPAPQASAAIGGIPTRPKLGGVGGNRPKMSLNLGGLMRPPAIPGAATRDHLQSNLGSLRTAMAGLESHTFQSNDAALDYKQMQGTGFTGEHEGFKLSNVPLQDVFMHAKRPGDQPSGEFAGDKLHVSLAEGQVEEGFNALKGLLFSQNSPINEWKITDMGRAPAGERVTQGAQLTLYVKPGANGNYSAQDLKKLQDFTGQLEHTLNANEIGRGARPESDVAPDHWNYVSYRNEFRSGREGGEAQAESLKNEPFFKLVSGT
ncbi:type III effector phosphothreonine lyase [Trinickia fusca]|uniref:Type III effector phosphothreonine lyase n=1 Tax=Trinickia fusca TaxID=2419777 RepID=A0A494XBU3_9BURK|nr:type III effector phosphothreonine lyase [Trinickia fusca]RKP48235.1 type III effector phosphothreonine lyase [Trinickia fusca]